MNNGTPIKDSPKPKVDLTSEAIKLIIRTKIIVLDMFISPAVSISQIQTTVNKEIRKIYKSLLSN
jgi:hypothetical protein